MKRPTSEQNEPNSTDQKMIINSKRVAKNISGTHNHNGPQHSLKLPLEQEERKESHKNFKVQPCPYLTYEKIRGEFLNNPKLLRNPIPLDAINTVYQCNPIISEEKNKNLKKEKIHETPNKLSETANEKLTIINMEQRPKIFGGNVIGGTKIVSSQGRRKTICAWKRAAQPTAIYFDSHIMNSITSLKLKMMDIKDIYFAGTTVRMFEKLIPFSSQVYKCVICIAFQDGTMSKVDRALKVVKYPDGDQNKKIMNIIKNEYITYLHISPICDFFVKFYGCSLDKKENSVEMMLEYFGINLLKQKELLEKKKKDLSGLSIGNICSIIIKNMCTLQLLNFGHFDLKPRNLLISPLQSPEHDYSEDTQIKIIDFGTSNIFQSIDFISPQPQNTQYDVLPAFTAKYTPEEIRAINNSIKNPNKQGIFWNKYDIYSFGVTLLHLALPSDLHQKIEPNRFEELRQEIMKQFERQEYGEIFHWLMYRGEIKNLLHPDPVKRPNFIELRSSILTQFKNFGEVDLDIPQFIKFERRNVVKDIRAEHLLQTVVQSCFDEICYYVVRDQASNEWKIAANYFYTAYIYSKLQSKMAINSVLYGIEHLVKWLINTNINIESMTPISNTTLNKKGGKKKKSKKKQQKPLKELLNINEIELLIMNLKMYMVSKENYPADYIQNFEHTFEQKNVRLIENGEFDEFIFQEFDDKVLEGLIMLKTRIETVRGNKNYGKYMHVMNILLFVVTKIIRGRETLPDMNRLLLLIIGEGNKYIYIYIYYVYSRRVVIIITNNLERGNGLKEEIIIYINH